MGGLRPCCRNNDRCRGRGGLGVRLLLYWPAEFRRARQPSADAIIKRRQQHRLGEIVVHPGRETQIAFPFKRVGGECDDGKMLLRALLRLADHARQGVAVDERHVAIGQEQSVTFGVLPDQVPSLLPIGGELRRITQTAELRANHELICFVVFGDQDQTSTGGSLIDAGRDKVEPLARGRDGFVGSRGQRTQWLRTVRAG